MLTFSTIEKVKALRLGAMAHALEQQLQDTNAYSELGFEERLGLLVDAEWNHRQAKGWSVSSTPARLCVLIRQTHPQCTFFITTRHD